MNKQGKVRILTGYGDECIAARIERHLWRHEIVDDIILADVVVLVVTTDLLELIFWLSPELGYNLTALAREGRVVTAHAKPCYIGGLPLFEKENHDGWDTDVWLQGVDESFDDWCTTVSIVVDAKLNGLAAGAAKEGS